ncbi:hypothetical protein EYF80_024665 [Liparis tanakae]|uniref:Uncharacterized protein n=1 Tax=Liparis tanakae TaxID=230148 RepID=A0A4Z2HHB7_9TELE|nr:hypothetical protein EYF80_024665 [Liparis tanakae]
MEQEQSQTPLHKSKALTKSSQGIHNANSFWVEQGTGWKLLRGIRPAKQCQILGPSLQREQQPDNMEGEAEFVLSLYSDNARLSITSATTCPRFLLLAHCPPLESITAFSVMQEMRNVFNRLLPKQPSTSHNALRTVCLGKESCWEQRGQSLPTGRERVHSQPPPPSSVSFCCSALQERFLDASLSPSFTDARHVRAEQRAPNTEVN